MSKLDTAKYITPYTGVSLIAAPDGHIVWRRGTGDNVELLHIASYTLRQGVGRRLISQMVRQLENNPPYHTVFGFTLPDNDVAHKFYKALGFTCSLVTGVYKAGQAVVFSQPFTELLERVRQWEKGLNFGLNQGGS